MNFVSNISKCMRHRRETKRFMLIYGYSINGIFRKVNRFYALF